MTTGGNVRDSDKAELRAKVLLSFGLIILLLGSLVSMSAMSASGQNSTSSSAAARSNSTASQVNTEEEPEPSSNSTQSESGDTDSNQTATSNSTSVNQNSNSGSTENQTSIGNMTSSESDSNSAAAVMASTSQSNASSTLAGQQGDLGNSMSLSSDDQNAAPPLQNGTIATNATTTFEQSAEPMSQNPTRIGFGEPLIPAEKSITRSYSVPVLKFEGELVAEVIVSITWNADGSVIVSDDRGYSYAIKVPSSQGNVTVLQNSTTIDQQVIGADLQYDIYWTPSKNQKTAEVEGYKFAIAGTVLNGSSSVVSLALEGGNYDENDGAKFVVTQTIAGKANSNLAPELFVQDFSVGVEPMDGLQLDWSDAINHDYKAVFDPARSSLDIPVGKSFFIDPYVITTVNSNLSPGAGSYFEGQNRLVVTNGSRINAFYYHSSNVYYRTSDDEGDTWSSSTSLGTGPIASDNHRWTVVRVTKDETTQYVSVLYWNASGSTSYFYSKPGTITFPSATIVWGSPVLIMSVSADAACSGPCAAVAASADNEGNLYAAIRYTIADPSPFSYIIKKSTDGGYTWSTSLPEVTNVSSFRPVITITPLSDNKMLFAYLLYDTSNLYYRIFNGTTWGSIQNISSAGLASNTLKQISSATSEGLTAYIAYTNVTASSGGILKTAIFFNNTFSGIETADSSLRHNNPSILVAPNGDMNILSLSNGKVYDTRKSTGSWELPFNPYGTSFSSPDQLTAAVVAGMIGGIWREGTSSPYNLMFDALEHGIVVSSTSIKSSPGQSDYYDGERRVFTSSNYTVFAFYYDGSKIMYKTSIDDGHTWDVSGVSTGIGQLASDDYRWSITHYNYGGSERVTLFYYNVSGSNTQFYGKTFAPNGRQLQPQSTALLFSASNDASCSPTGVCAAASGASDNNATVFVSFSYKTSGTWYVRILRSADGGQTWINSHGPSSVSSTGSRLPISMTKLDAGKMLFVFAKYDSSSMFYKLYNGTTWSSSVTLSGMGWSTNTIKHISSDTVDGIIANTTSSTAFIAYLSGGNSGSLKVATFEGEEGMFLGIETADSTLSHSLPSLTVTSSGVLHIYSLSGNLIYDTERNGTSWLSPTNPYGSDYSPPDQLTAQIAGLHTTGVMWRGGAASPYEVRYNGVLDGLGQFPIPKLSPSSTDTYEGERRIVAVGKILFAFWYNTASSRPTSIYYESSLDSGNSWRKFAMVGVGDSSSGTGPLNGEAFRWTVATSKVGTTNYVSVLYYVQSSGSTSFYSYRAQVGTGASIGTLESWQRSLPLKTIANNSGCNSGTSVCAAVSAATDSTGSVIYAAYRWIPSGAGSKYNYQIWSSSDGGKVWNNALGPIATTYANPIQVTLTKLATGKMLFAYLTYEQSALYWRAGQLATWDQTDNTVTGTGMSTSTRKQISSDSNSGGKAFAAYGQTSGSVRSFRLATWNGDGSFDRVTNPDGLTQSLPSVTVTPDNVVHIYFLSVLDNIYDKRMINGIWQTRVPVFSDITASNQDVEQLTSALGYSAAMWKRFLKLSTTYEELRGGVEDMDIDGDGAYNNWEKNGIDYNGDYQVDFVLPSAKYNHKNIWVEIDYMPNQMPTSSYLSKVKTPFLAAPVSNPDGITGITLTFNIDEQITDDPVLTWPTEFQSVKAMKFGTSTERGNANTIAAKKLLFRYNIWAHEIDGPDVVPGQTGNAELPGNDFVIALGTYMGEEYQKGGFMHELGHNLGLRHGGFQDKNCKPNYISVMNYLYQYNIHLSNRVLDYSIGTRNNLVENALDENKGITGSAPVLPFIYGTSVEELPSHAVEEKVGFTGSPRDWDRDDNYEASSTENISNFGADVGDQAFCHQDTFVPETLQGYNDWAHIKLASDGRLEYAGGAQTSHFGHELTIGELTDMNLNHIHRFDKLVASLGSDQFARSSEAPIEKAAIHQMILLDPLGIEESAKSLDFGKALSVAKKLKSKFDGSIGGNKMDDVITNPDLQRELLYEIAFTIWNFENILDLPHEGDAFVQILNPNDGATYKLHENVTVEWHLVDIAMDRKVIEATAASGSLLDTSSPGAKKFIIKTVDLEGKVEDQEITYYVKQGNE